MSFSVYSRSLLFNNQPCIHHKTKQPIKVDDQGFLFVLSKQYLRNAQLQWLQTSAEYRSIDCPTVIIRPEFSLDAKRLSVSEIQNASVIAPDSQFSVSGKQLMHNQKPCIHKITNRPILVSNKNFLMISNDEYLLDPRPEEFGKRLLVDHPFCAGQCGVNIINESPPTRNYIAPKLDVTQVCQAVIAQVGTIETQNHLWKFILILIALVAVGFIVWALQ